MGTEGALVVASIWVWGRLGEITKECEVSLCSDENVIVMAAQLCEYSKSHQSV